MLTLAGIFIGGASTRMGGSPKGLRMLSTGETLVDRWRTLFDALGIPSTLVGRLPAYAPRPMLDDAPHAGPLGGLIALLRHALTTGTPRVLAVACDMPHVTPLLVTRLLEAPDAAAVAPRRDGRWEPMLARYDAARAREVAETRASRGELSLHGLLDALGAHELPLSPNEAMELDDWDTMDDVERRPL